MDKYVFGHKNKVYPLCNSKKSHTQTLNLLLLTQENKSHYVFIKDFNCLMYSKTKDQHKKKSLHVLFTKFHKEEILNLHKKQFLLINGCKALNQEQ